MVALKRSNVRGAKGCRKADGGMERTRENQPAPVSAVERPRSTGATQAGEAGAVEPGRVRPVRERWAWVEPSVWTDRMLTALENGVKGNVWFSLIDKVYAPANLAAAFEKVSSNQGAAGVDQVTTGMFEDRVEANLMNLSEQLRTDQYRPQAVRRV